MGIISYFTSKIVAFPFHRLVDAENYACLFFLNGFKDLFSAFIVEKIKCLSLNTI